LARTTALTRRYRFQALQARGEDFETGSIRKDMLGNKGCVMQGARPGQGRPVPLGRIEQLYRAQPVKPFVKSSATSLGRSRSSHGLAPTVEHAWRQGR